MASIISHHDLNTRTSLRSEQVDRKTQHHKAVNYDTHIGDHVDGQRSSLAVPINTLDKIGYQYGKMDLDPYLICTKVSSRCIHRS